MNKTIIASIIAAVVLVGGYFLLKSTYKPTAPITQPSAAQTPATKEKVITYTDSGYLPATLIVKRGETVIFKNQSSQSMWTASGLHPTHRIYSGTSLDEHCSSSVNNAFDACKGILPGGLWSFTFDKVGTWKYHDHLSPSDFGTIVVE